MLEPRAMCYRCVRPHAMCVCGLVARVANRTEVIILQHPRERHHPLGTVRLLRLGLERIAVQELAPRDPESVARVAAFPPGAALLYPGGRELSDLAPHERPERLVVLDGTWHQASKLFLASPAVQALPRVGLTPRLPSRYRIRREPRAECLSTLEAICTALLVLEPDTPGLGGLIDAFVAMIDRQAIFGQNKPRARERRRRAPRRSELPEELRRAPEGLLVVYGELVRARDDARRRALVQWSAVRLATGELFTALVRPDFAPDPLHLTHMGLDVDAVHAAPRAAEVVPAWQSFRRSDDLCVAWNPGSLDLLAASAGVALKPIYNNVRRGRVGHLEDVMRREGLSSAPVAAPGRAAARLGNAVAVLHALRTGLEGT